MFTYELNHGLFPSTGVSQTDSRSLDWASILLVWALVLTTTRRLLVTNWTDDLYLIAYIVNIAFWFGVALGYSRFRPSQVALLATIYGIFFIGWRLGLLQNSTSLWSEKISTILVRLSIILNRVSNQQPVYDNLLFLFIMMILFWMLGLNAGYSLVRSKHVLRIIVPLFLAIILIHSYDSLVPARAGYLYLFSALAVLVIGRLFYTQQSEGWRRKRFYVPPQLSSEALQYTIGLVIIFLFFSFILPANRSQLESMVRAWEKIKEPFQSIRQDFENAFSSLRVSTQIQPEFYDRTLNLGFGNELSEEEIFTAIAQAKIPADAHIYWRSRVYDHYENGQWTLSDYSTREFAANSFEVDLPAFTNRTSRLYSFTISLNQPLSPLILPAQPYWTNLAVQVEYLENQDGTLDILAIRSSTPPTVGKTYNARASLSITTAQQLRQAGEEYPTWVTERYLQLPSTLSERTHALALEITQDLSSPYEKAVAITDYLRTHITYIATLEDLPPNQDLIDWFLFDSKKGFCNYYATAAVLMLRSLGIPARLAVGFAQGTMEDIQAANVYVVRQRDAHAWPEVFFPNIGWIEFEPTSSQPAISYPLQQEESQTNTLPPEINPQDILKKLQEEKANDAQSIPDASNNRSLFLSLAISILVLTSSFIWIKFNRQKVSLAYQQLPEYLEQGIRRMGFTPPKILVHWNRRSKLSTIEKSYQHINTALHILKSPPPIHFTPTERASRLLVLLPEAENEIRQLIKSYQDSLYGTSAAVELDTKILDRKIIHLAWHKRIRNDLARLLRQRDQ
ncbi:MAG: transglutaminaseTgpA domain-containing protein [Anaerolineales bacterium]